MFSLYPLDIELVCWELVYIYIYIYIYIIIIIIIIITAIVFLHALIGYIGCSV